MRIINALMLLSAVGLGFTACSSDDDTPVDGKAMRFNVTVPRAPRAATTTQSINQFNLYSFVDGAEYMSNVTVTRNGTEWEASPAMYWPGDGQAVDFYCISPMVGTETVTDTSVPNIKDYVNTDGTTDLLYAVTRGAKANPVKINFRHALAKLAFNFKRREASSSQAPLRVEVKGVTVTDVNSTASFTYPSETTAAGGEAVGIWSAQSMPKDAVIYQNATTVLTDNYMNINSTDYMFAIPQAIAQSEADKSGAYVKVLCAVYDEASGVRIWPRGASEDYLYFPLNSPGASNVTTSWEAGKAYAYNITIGVPAGTGKIEFDITVDEYPAFEDMYLE